MGFRFRRTIKIAPGIRLNLSKSGVTTSIGTRGARVTLGGGKRRYTVGLPGTGLSHTVVERTDSERSSEPGSVAPLIWILLILFLLSVVFGR